MKLSTSLMSIGDSQVIFRELDSHSKYSAGRIHNMYMWPKTAHAENKGLQSFFVSTLQPLSLADCDYDSYSLFDHAGKLFYSVYAVQPIILSIDEILGHFASTL